MLVSTRNSLSTGSLTKPVTMILLSLGGADGPVGTPLVADLADFTDFLTPPTGALTAVLVAFAGLWGRRVRLAFLRVLRISSRDWSSFPDIAVTERFAGDGRESLTEWST